MPGGLYLFHGTTSVCAIKVRIVLAEKGLDWNGETLDLMRGDQHRPEYARINPNRVVPTLRHDGRILIESTLIIEYLDEAFPAPPLMPRDPYERAQARLFMKKIDDYLHPACSVVTFATANRRALLKLSAEELEARFQRMPDPAYRERQRLAIDHGLDAPHVAQAVRQHDRYFGDMEAALSAAPYLAGEDLSLADAAALPYVNRADMIGLDGLWQQRPRLADWLDRMRARPSFAQAVSGWMSDADRQRFDVPRDETRAKVRTILAGGPE
jgi:glutathione S-transferase